MSKLKEAMDAFTKARDDYEERYRPLEIPRKLERKETWHFFHFIMTILTGGLWLLVWLFCGLSNSQYNKRKETERQYEVLRKLSEDVKEKHND